ncbi:MAG: WecB/TagA/CpsF family glycosyltransferase [Candidatus Actinomarina sp.]|tara:strand:- start:123 stop:857 length:735 start_codon:yes stop_codon:yes gene_type:complete
MNSVLVLKTMISTTNVENVATFLKNEKSRTVAICNSNTLVRSYNDPTIQNKINSFDIKVPDGFPVAKSSKILYKNAQDRVDGFNIFHKTIENGISQGLTHYFYGSNFKVVDLMIQNLKIIYPEIRIAGFFCPPIKTYQELTEEQYVTDLINKNADVVWVSLGFPKQEEFIYELKSKYEISSNLVGIGAVFEWVAKTKIKAPEWIANLGLEWVLRLIQEPKRLLRRYLIDNFLFIIYFIKQYLNK